MNLWLIVWAFLALSLAVFVAWTFWILMKQKRAWSIFAEKRKLRYNSQSLMSGAELNGVIGDHTVGVFTSEHVSADARGVRKLTAIEVNLNSSMPIDGGIASGGMVPILKKLRFKQELLPKHEAWKKSYIASSNHKQVLDSYLNDARIKAICELMEIPNSWVILIFKDGVMLLRIDVADPLHDAKRLDQRIKDILAVAKICELEPGEAKRLKSLEVKAVAQGVELEVDEDIIGGPTGFTLEDDESDDGAASVEVADPVDVSEDVDAQKADEPKKKNAKGAKPSASSKSNNKKK
ncbi:MAG: hypothetical protein GW778_01940 [Alphaproteobacteria bacterium]|nr:hypothetical protein [Alphaproteobacteria bacterium]